MFPCQNPAGTYDSVGINGTPDLFIVETLSNCLVLQETVHLLGLCSGEELTMFSCQLGQLNFGIVHFLGEEEDGISFQGLSLTVGLHVNVKADSEGLFSFLKS